MTIKAGVFLNLSKNNMGLVSEPKTDDVSVDVPEVSPTEVPPVLDEPNYFVDELPEITVPTSGIEDVYSYDLTNEQEEIMAHINKVQNEQFDYEQYVINQLQEELDIAKEELQKQEEEDGFISDLFNGFKELTTLGVSKSEVKDAIKKQEETINLLIEAKKTGKFERVYEQITGNKYDEQKLMACHQAEKDLEGIQAGLEVILNSDESDEIKQQYINEFLIKHQEASGKSYEELTNEYKELSEQYLGSSNELTNVLNKYTQSQDGFVDKAANAVQIGGMGMMIVGGIACFIPGGQVIGAGMMKAGQMMAMAGTFGDNALEAIDLATNDKKFSEEKEEYKQLGKETLVDAALFAAGYGAGTAANAVGSTVLKKTGSTLLSKAADIGTDMVLSLAGDAAITGEVDLAGEGFSQLLGVLTGSAAARMGGVPKIDYIKGSDGEISFKTTETKNLFEIQDKNGVLLYQKENLSKNTTLETIFDANGKKVYAIETLQDGGYTKKYFGNDGEVRKVVSGNQQGEIEHVEDFTSVDTTGIQEKMPEFLYHITSKDSLDAIQEQGLMQNRDKTIETEGNKAVFLISEYDLLNTWCNLTNGAPEIAHHSMLARLLKYCGKGGSDLTILKIPTSSLDLNSLKMRTQKDLVYGAPAYYEIASEKIDDYHTLSRHLKENNSGEFNYKDIVENIYAPDYKSRLQEGIPLERIDELSNEPLEFFYAKDIDPNSIEGANSFSISEIADMIMDESCEEKALDIIKKSLQGFN